MFCWNLSFLDGLAVFGIGWEMAIFSMHLASIIYSKLYINKPPIDTKCFLEGVSILKPLKGVDPNLEHNLETFFQLDYPQFEILFCIEDRDDPVVEVCRRLIRKYPSVGARIIIGGKNAGVNPKINNLIPGYHSMKYNFFWMCDSGIMARPLTLSDLVSKMTGKVALVHAPPYVMHRKGLSSAVEKVYFGTHHARTYICANIVGSVCTNGMSMLIRKDYMEVATGGLENMSHYLAEDYFIGKFLVKNGYKTTISSYPALQNFGDYTMGNYLRRMIRWSTLRLFVIPHIVVVEPFVECFISGLIFSWSCLHLFSWSMPLVFLCHLFTWILLDFFFCRLLEGGKLKMTKMSFLVAWFVRESLTPYILLRILCDSTVVWRTRKFRPRCGGKGDEII